MRISTILSGVFAAIVSASLAVPRLAAEQAAKIDFGDPAPQWLREAESYAFQYHPDDWDALAQSKVKFITHCPIDRDFFTRCHALGIRCFPYVTFYQGHAAQSYQDVNLKDQQEFIEIDAQGNLTRTGFWESEDAKNRYTTCPNVAEYQDAMVAWVQKIMELGADGVFVDNLGTRRPCYGPKFGRHKHIYDDQNHAFAMLLKRVREVIKRYRPEGALLANSASPLNLPAEYWKYIDADMLESYICTWVSKERWFDWKTHWHTQGVQLRPYIEAGKQVQALSYLGHTPYGVKEDAFFCYATARLAGFVWNGGRPLSRPDIASLYRLRLGRPLGNEVEENGVYWRAFEAGLVAVNPDRSKDGFFAVKRPIPATRFYDVFAEKVLDESDKLPLPPYSGRVFLYTPATANELTKSGPRLTVVTQARLGAVRFRVDGFDYWTHSGRWTTEYVLGPDFGTFSLTFDKPGKHVVEVVDVIPADMKTSAGYGSGQRLGKFMDPSNPTRPSEGRKFRFRGWTGPVTSSQAKIEVDVPQDTRLTAAFDVQK